MGLPLPPPKRRVDPPPKKPLELPPPKRRGDPPAKTSLELPPPKRRGDPPKPKLEVPPPKRRGYLPADPVINNTVQASDWEFAGILSTSASMGLMAGGWVFSFRSKSANAWGDFAMVGGGVGTPGTSVEVSLPDFKQEDLSWSSIKCLKAFSLAELSWSSGSILTGGVSIFGAGYSQVYATAGMPSNRYFQNALNDGYGVVGEKLSAAEALAKGLDPKGLKAKGFNAGAGGALGVWIPCGSVVKKFLEAVGMTVILAGTTLINTLGGGLFAAGEALLSGRGEAVAYKFCNGYADMLANLTSPEPDLPDATFSTLKYLDWAARVQEYGGIYIEHGSEANNVLSAVEQAGQAAVLQDVLNFGQKNGADAWYDAKKNHRSRYGADDYMRYQAYRDLLYGQVKKGDKILGLRIDI